MWVIELIGFFSNLFSDLFSFSEDNAHNRVIADVNRVVAETNALDTDLPELPEVNLEWLDAALNQYSKISVLNREDWLQLNEDLYNSFTQSLPKILKSNYDFLENEETLIIEKYHTVLTKNIEDFINYNNYTITGNLINILELVEQKNLTNAKISINSDFLKHINSTKYGRSSEFFKDHFIRSLSVNELNPSSSSEQEVNKYKKYMYRKSLIKDFLEKKKLL